MLAVHHEAPCLEVVEKAVGRPRPGAGPAMRDAPARDVGLRKDRDLDLGQDEPAGDRRRHHAGPRRARRGRDDRRMHALGRQRGGQPPRPCCGGGTQGDRVALAHQPGDPGGQAGRVPRHRVETADRECGHVRALGNGRQRRDTGRALAEQALEGHVQPGEALLLSLLRPPGRGQRLGQRGLLVEQLDPAVANPARLHQDDLRPGRQEVGQNPRRVVEEGQPRLHAVELRALGQVLPHRRAPGPPRHQGRRGVAQRRRDDELATAVERHGAEVVRRPLVADRERGQPVHLVAPQVDADRHVGGGGEDVDDAAAHRELAAVLHLVFAPVPHGHQLGEELAHVDLLAPGG